MGVFAVAGAGQPAAGKSRKPSCSAATLQSENATTWMLYDVKFKNVLGILNQILFWEHTIQIYATSPQSVKMSKICIPPLFFV
jgi:hypothetical protein